MNYHQNLFHTPSAALNTETIHLLLQKSNITLEVIRSNLAQPTQWYDQDQDEWVLLLEGEAILEYEDHSTALHPGDHVFIPKHIKHRVSSTSQNALWLCLFSS